MKQLLVLVLTLSGACSASAQDIPNIISTGISKVIRAADLAIQRAQTSIIVTQEAQKALENIMSATLLDDISDWVRQQKDLYGEYFAELQAVKQVVTDYHRIKEAVQRQEAIVTAYQQAMAQFRRNSHFSAGELTQMERTYTAFLTQSEHQLEQLLKAVGTGNFQMTDQQRLATIDTAADEIDRNYRDLQSFTQQNQLLALQRIRDETDYQTLLKLYGL